MKKHIVLGCLAVVTVLLLISGCRGQQQSAETTVQETETSAPREAGTEGVTAEPEQSETESQTAPITESADESETESETVTEAASETETESAGETESETEARSADVNGYRVTIDPGHASVIAPGTDPIGPGADEQKAKDSGGTTGVATGIPEYVLNLELSFKLRDELVNRGYEVYMTREDHDTPVGNVERASVANDSGSDIFVRMHANGSEDSSVQGGMTICQTPDNPYIGYMYDECRRLSDLILNHMMDSAGIADGIVWETDIMTGSNWSQVPVTIVEVGYMSNPDEDQRMAEEEYQNQLVQGIANGIDAYFGE